MVRVDVCEPEMVPPSDSGTPSFLHWYVTGPYPDADARSTAAAPTTVETPETGGTSNFALSRTKISEPFDDAAIRSSCPGVRVATARRRVGPQPRSYETGLWKRPLPMPFNTVARPEPAVATSAAPSASRSAATIPEDMAPCA